MNFHNLVCILEIWKCGSINKAAQNLFTSQSNLSHSIRVLENELGFSLFTRNSKGISLTPEGRLFVQSAQTILSEYNKMKEIPSQFNYREDLSVSCTYSALFMQIFIQFLNQHPACGYRDAFKETGLIQVMEDIVEQRYRVAVFYCFEEREPAYRAMADKYHMTLRPLKIHIPLEVIMNPLHPLAHAAQISYRDLPKQNLVTYENFNADDWLTILKLNNEENVTYIFDRGGLLDTIKNGNYISVVVKNSIFITKNSGIIAVPLDFDKYIGIYLMCSKSCCLNHREKMFISYLTKQL